MRKRALLLVLTLALAFAGVAVAKVVTVQLTASGPQPATVTVDWGDTVSLANGAGGVQVVNIPRAGVTGQTVEGGQTYEFVATGQDGNYNFNYTGTGRPHSGRITVQLTGEVTLEAKPESVVFGRKATFSGRSTVPNSAVTIQQRNLGEETEWVDVAEVIPDEEGAFSAAVKPSSGARFRATAAADQVSSKPIFVAVAPKLQVRVSDRNVPAGSRIVVTGIVAPAGAVKILDLEVYEPARKRWDRLASKRMRGAVRVTFTVSVDEGRSRVRVSVRRTGLVQGFAAAASPFVIVTGT